MPDAPPPVPPHESLTAEGYLTWKGYGYAYGWQGPTHFVQDINDERTLCGVPVSDLWDFRVIGRDESPTCLRCKPKYRRAQRPSPQER